MESTATYLQEWLHCVTCIISLCLLSVQHTLSGPNLFTLPPLCFASVLSSLLFMTSQTLALSWHILCPFLLSRLMLLTETEAKGQLKDLCMYFWVVGKRRQRRTCLCELTELHAVSQKPGGSQGRCCSAVGHSLSRGGRETAAIAALCDRGAGQVPVVGMHCTAMRSLSSLGTQIMRWVQRFFFLSNFSPLSNIACLWCSQH